MTEKEDVRLRAELVNLPIRPEDLALAIQGWALIQPHLERVMAESLPPTAEPASLFRPSPLQS